jgi:uncharacterized protein (DUF2147 family)
MKLLIAGSRSFAKQHKKIEAVIEAILAVKGWEPTTVISGCAKGVDQIGQLWAEKNGVEIIRKPALWNKHGITAGLIRNKEMFDIADKAIIIWDGKSTGSKHTLSLFEGSDKEFVLWTPGSNS